VPPETQSEFADLTPEDLLMRQWREIEARRIAVESKMLALGMEIPDRNPTPVAGRKPKSVVEAVRFASRDLKREITKGSVVRWMEKKVDWKDPVNPQTVTSTLQRLRADLEIVESIPGGKGRATVYQIPRTVPLERTQYDLLMKQPPQDRHKGGFQSLIYLLQKSVRELDKDHWEIRISDETVERIRRYYSNHGGGGYQAQLKKIFRDSLDFETKNIS